LLSFYEFDGDNVTIIQGSALQALEGDEAAIGKIKELMDAVDSDIPTVLISSYFTFYFSFLNYLFLANKRLGQALCSSN